MGARDPFSFPEVMRPVLLQPARYKVLRGGRGSGKSWGVAEVLVVLASLIPLRVLCARELQISIADSVHRLLCDWIDRKGLQSRYVITNTSISCPSTGSLFIFKGLKHNISEIKSMEGIDICWVEEAQRVSESSWETLIPTIRKEGSEIWITFNPDSEDDPTWLRFVANPPPSCLSAEVNYIHNQHFPETLRAEMEHLMRVDYEAYLHVWMGQPKGRSKAQVLFGKWRVDRWDSPPPGADGPYYGADWGFSVDPSAGVRCWLDGRRLLIDYEVGGVNIELDDLRGELAKLPGLTDGNGRVIRGDSSRPETIAHLARNRPGQPGLRLIAADKWPGSVEDGIAWLRGLDEIVIHERCTNVIQEARLWSYKTDRLTDDVLPVLKPGNDHWWDAVRYALQPLIKKRDPIKAVPNFHMAR